MKRKQPVKKVGSMYDGKTIFLVMTGLFLLIVTVYAVMQATSLRSSAYSFNDIVSCGMRCEPADNTCPATAPYCVPVRTNARRVAYRCSQQTDRLSCSVYSVTPFPTPSYRPTPDVTRIVWPSGYPMPTCSPDRETPCYMP